MPRCSTLIATAVLALAGCGTSVSGADGSKSGLLTDFSCTNQSQGFCLIRIGGSGGSACPFDLDGVAPNKHRLTFPAQGQTEIRWQLVGQAAARYEFRFGGDFALKHGASSTQFSGAGLMNGDPKTLKVTDANNDGQQYEYMLLLHSRSGGDDCLIDPYIRNN